MLRTAFIALLAPMTAGTAACGEPPPELAFRGHVRTRLNEPGAFERRIDIAPDFRVTVETTRSYGRVQFTGSLTNPGRDRLAAATSQVELAWDPPYDCLDCTQFDSYRFVHADGTPVAVRTYPGVPPPEFPLLSQFIEQIFYELTNCTGGPHTNFCERIDLPE